ncbi:putative multicopper oxidase type 3 [Candidatus Nitrososphaera gargensis Ga9.2]|uniref:Putative multicopper oxidase type 3 n=1 Tax=Nitrososphaera gargensis (strain Ga9.2) TaxID=1237085 RepID=K0ING4_NITGG|nr:multicopper oxidase domain-containing protein [Candidatus Nitrososphaera gargensis]AFU59329.1 putative multicopper oxidase type 3 [Candidatus Nitrososphaera gargensis Ga9.2]
MPEKSLLSVLFIAGMLGASLAALPLMQAHVSASKMTDNNISIEEYDKMKNCTTDLDKRPTSIEYLTHFNCGRVSTTEDGQTIREFTLIVEENQTVPVSHEGHTLNAWTFNGTVPGPTMRMTEGDLVRITVINSEDSVHPHSLHMHSIHEAAMDGVQSDPIAPGDSFTYEFIAQPYGVYPYHCHIDPIADHINRGLYGILIIDPKEPRPQMTELAMMMNSYDLDYDLEGPVTIPTVQELESGNRTEEEERGNEIYTVNGKAFDYMHYPIELEVGKDYRIYVVNMVEFDLVNSFHVHGALFEYYPSGTSDKPAFTNDIIVLGQGDRGIMEMSYKYPGKYMFHAHVSEFTDLGWMGFFNVTG